MRDHDDPPTYIVRQLLEAITDAGKMVDDGRAVDALRLYRPTASLLDEGRDWLVAEARRAGVTWQAIGDALGVDRQVVWRKYHKSLRQPD